MPLPASNRGKPFEALVDPSPVAELTVLTERFTQVRCSSEQLAAVARQQSECLEGLDDAPPIAMVQEPRVRRVEQLLRLRMVALDACAMPKRQRGPGAAAPVSQVVEAGRCLRQQPFGSGVVS